MSDAKTDAKAIFSKALDCKGAEELRRFLEQACGADAASRGRVEELLRAHQDAGAFLGGAEQQEATRDQPIAERPGTIIGPYKLLEEIGEGGMGVVYMAEQQQPVRRKVALKIIKPGMDTRAGDRPLRGRAAGAGADGPPQHRQGARRRRDRARAGPTSSWSWSRASRSPSTATRAS